MIKVQNIYHMLSYAFQVLVEDGYRNIIAENFEDAEDLFAAILAKGIINQIKRGLGREYFSFEDTLYSLQGKANISSSIRKLTFNKKQLVCEYDELSENAYINQILKTAMMILIHSKDVKPKQKTALRKILHYFHNVDTLKSNDIKWANVRYHSNNSTYKMLIYICYLIIEMMIPANNEGSRKFLHFKDEYLYKLFERFVYEYYKKHYSIFKISASHIDWTVDDGFHNYLPTMKTDITLEFNEKTLIIDTKYYNHIFQKNYLNSNITIRSGHLYQIYAYVKNKDINHTGNVSGVLLYAKTDEEIIPNTYLIDGNKISIRILDLDKDFSVIRKQLDNIIEDWINDYNSVNSRVNFAKPPPP